MIVIVRIVFMTLSFHNHWNGLLSYFIDLDWMIFKYFLIIYKGLKEKRVLKLSFLNYFLNLLQINAKNNEENQI